MENNLFENFENVKIDYQFFQEIESEFMIEGGKKFDDNIIFLEGDGKILLSAPHSTTQGYLKDKKCDLYTEAIAILLHQKTGLPTILFKGKSDSQDFEDYKKIIRNVCLLHDCSVLKKIKFFIDIHGCHNYFAADIGTMYGKSLLGRFDLDFHLVKFLNEQGFEKRGFSRNLLISHNSFSAGDPSLEADDNSVILTEWVSKILGIPSLQLEISRNLRGENPVLTTNFLKGLVNYLNFVKTIV